MWYKIIPCADQAYIDSLLDLADYYLPCVYPLRDAFFNLLVCSDILVLERSLKQSSEISDFSEDEIREIVYV